MISKLAYVASATLMLIVASCLVSAESESNDIDRYIDFPVTSNQGKILRVHTAKKDSLGRIIPGSYEERIVDLSSSAGKVSASMQPSKSMTDEERLRSIAMNSREIRLMGPDQKEVEMKDDVPTKIVIAFDNLQKEASEVWEQVNSKLDKGWDEFKDMVERVVKKPEKKSEMIATSRSLREVPSKGPSSLVVVSDVDGYSMADEESAGAAIQQASDSTGNKIKGFFTDTLGMNEDNKNKATEALSKAGTSVSDTMTKDLPDALKKASSSVSDAVTKDIPDAFKNFFG